MSITTAPASRAMATPAVMSHGWLLSAMLQSTLPEATHTRSTAAEPNMRDPQDTLRQAIGESWPTGVALASMLAATHLPPPSDDPLDRQSAGNGLTVEP